MTALKLLDSIARYATLMTVMVGLVFGLMSALQAQRWHYLTAAANLVKSIQTPEFTKSIARLLRLPKNAAPELVLNDERMLSAAYVTSHVFESLGVLVFHRLLPLRLVDELIGGYIRACWTRLKPYVERQRLSLGSTFGEWFQWLAERLEEIPTTDLRNAAEANRDWVESPPFRSSFLGRASPFRIRPFWVRRVTVPKHQS